MKNRKSRLLYLYYADLMQTKVALSQALNTMDALGFYYHLTYLSPWISKRKLANLFDKYGLKNRFSVFRSFVLPSGNISLILFFNRLFYCLFSLIYAKVYRFDYIYTRDFSVLFFLAKIPKFFRPNATIVFEPHKIFYKVSDSVTYKQESKAYSIVDCFVAINAIGKNDLHLDFNVDKKNIMVAPSGFNLDFFRNKSINRNKKSTQEERVLVYSGSFLWWKGVDTLISSLGFIKTKKVKLLLLGGDGVDLLRMQNLVKKKGLEDRVVFMGYLKQKEMIKALCSADVAIIPNNLSEIGIKYTSPVKLFEYLACGLPIVCSDLPSMREVLQEYENALFFQPNNPKNLAQKVDLLLKDKRLRKKMSANNLKESPEYSWDNRAKKIFKFLEGFNNEG